MAIEKRQVAACVTTDIHALSESCGSNPLSWVAMTSAPIPDTEFARLLALARYDILDTVPEPAFDRITRLAAHLLGTPAAFLNFVDQHRQWGKAAFGITDTNADRSDSFCAWTIR